MIQNTNLLDPIIANYLGPLRWSELQECWRRGLPEKYRFVLRPLQTSDKSRLSLEEQASLYDEIHLFREEDSTFEAQDRAHNSLDGWAFFTPAGYGKTTISYRLYAIALLWNIQKWSSSHYQAYDWKENSAKWGDVTSTPRLYVWRKSVPDLLQQHFAKFNGEDVKPDITVEKIEEAVKRGFKPRVFLEEIDKIRPSEFVIDQLFRLFDALDRHQGQIVLDTNLSKQQFVDTFGEPIARRVRENCHVKEYGF
jgi:hypothetical protein